MRILQILSVGIESGGVETGVVRQREILKQRGHRVVTIASASESGQKGFNDYSFRPPPQGVLGQLIKTTFYLPAFRLTRRVCSAYKPDVVTIHTMHLTSAAVLYALNTRNAVLCVHGPEYYTKWLFPFILHTRHYRSRPYDVSDLTFAGRVQYAYLRWAVRPIFMYRVKRVGHVFAFSRYTQKMLAEEGIASTYLPNGVNLFSAKEGRKICNRVGYAGRLHEDKGVDYLLDVLNLARRKIPDLRMDIAGDGEMLERLRRKVDDLQLGSHVTFSGRLDRASMETFYQSVDLLLMASNQEAFGKVGVEAMSTGAPVLAPLVGGISDWLTDGYNGRFIPLRDVRAAADILIDTLAHAPNYEDMSQNAVESAKRFDANALVDRQLEIYESMVRGQ